VPHRCCRREAEPRQGSDGVSGLVGIALQGGARRPPAARRSRPACGGSAPGLSQPVASSGAAAGACSASASGCLALRPGAAAGREVQLAPRKVKRDPSAGQGLAVVADGLLGRPPELGHRQVAGSSRSASGWGCSGQWASPSRSAASWGRDPVVFAFDLQPSQTWRWRRDRGCSRSFLLHGTAQAVGLVASGQQLRPVAVMAEGRLGAIGQCGNGAPWRTRQARLFGPPSRWYGRLSSGCLGWRGTAGSTLN